jgi:hypothetical protein
MSYRESLSQRAIAISISDSPDMAVLGLEEDHLRDAMTEVARHLLALGARLAYGGDLRTHGFTELLFELVARHRRDADIGDERASVISYLAWPVHLGMPVEELKGLFQDMGDIAEVICLTKDGRVMPFDERKRLATRAPTESEWAQGLTAMRRVITDASDARVALGGRMRGFKGRMPGIAEEALSALQAGKPLFLLGGFGGCTRDIAEHLGIIAPGTRPRPPWRGRRLFVGLDASRLNNGLDAEENATLTRTVHVDQAVALLLRGLLRLLARSDDESSLAGEA